MQTHTLQILARNDVPVGAAFLVADDLLLTCAHVARAAGSAPGQAVSLRTPSGTELSATVEAWHDESAEDVASLRLDAPLDEISPLPLGASSGSKGHAFSTYGFPQSDQALSGGGTITGYATLNGIQYLQLESSQVTPGFSGAPVFDEVTQRVVGMVVAIAPPDEYQRQGTTAFAVPSETLRAIVPELQLSERSPYRSLDAFTEADADLFFGRERVVTKLLESLKRNPRFLAVLGPSGSGKSSVVQAGLIPALRNGQLSGSEKWGILSIRPGTQPFEQLASAGMSDPTQLVQAASDWLSAHPESERLLILIDQFEELLVSTPSDTRADFVAALADLLDSPLDVTVLLTLRDDFYSRFVQDAEPLVDWMAASQYIIPPTLEAAELRQMIERPARDLGLVFVSGLVDAILADARTADPSGRALRSTVLPLLEFALTQLWERRVDGELTHDAYRAIGGVTGGLSQWADRAYYGLDEAKRTIARRVFSELVTLGDETQGIADTRRVRSIAELTAKDGDETKSVLDALVTARLLVARHDESSGQDTVEIIHETLLREWGLLESWLQDDRQFLLWREGLRAAQQAWTESGQDAGALLRGVPLAEAEGWLEKRRDDLGEAEKDYISKSVALRVRGERNRRWVMAGLGLVAVLMAGLAFWGSSSATEARNQAATAEAASTLAVANEATAHAASTLAIENAEEAKDERDRAEEQAYISHIREISAQSISLRENNFSVSQLLAIEANQGIDNVQTRSILLNDIQANPLLRQYLNGHNGGVTSLAFSPDGSLLVSGDKQGYIIFWDFSSGKMLIPPIKEHPDSIMSINFNPDGTMLVSGSFDGTMLLWDVTTHKPIDRPANNQSYSGRDVVFSPDGNFLAWGNGDDVTIWDINTRKPFKNLLSNQLDSIYKVLFSPDGRILAASDKSGYINFWDINTRELLLQEIATASYQAFEFAFSPDGKIFVIGDTYGYIEFWDIYTQKLIGERVIGHLADITSIAFSPNGEILISGSQDKQIITWDVATHKQIGMPLRGHSAMVNSLIFSGDGEYLLSGGDDHAIIVWSMNEQSTSIEYQLPESKSITSVAFSPDGQILATRGAEVNLWDLSTSQRLGNPLQYELNWTEADVTFSPDGEMLASLNNENEIILWNLSSHQSVGQPLTGFPKESRIIDIAFSADGKILAANSRDDLIYWDIDNFTPLGKPLYKDLGPLFGIAFHPVKNTILAVYNFGILSWDLDTKLPTKFPKIDDYWGGYDFAISPDGKILASGDLKGNIVLWDLDTFTPIDTMTGHLDEVSSIAFSPNGKQLVSSSFDGEIILWDVESRVPIGSLLEKNSVPIYGLTFSPDGATVASGSTDNGVTVWSIDNHFWIEMICKRVGRNFAFEEWKQYFPNEEYRLTCPQWPIDEDALAAMDK